MPHNHKFVELKDRPRCSIDGCTSPGQHTGKYDKDGNPYFRELCHSHHYKKLSSGHNLTVTNFVNTWHPSRKHRDMHCYNIDNRLGDGGCTATITWIGQLTVDHIDGDPNNNDPKNLQTLCSNCHDLKTHLFRDWATPGRRERKTIPGSARVIAAVKKRRSSSRYSTLPLQEL